MTNMDLPAHEQVRHQVAPDDYASYVGDVESAIDVVAHCLDIHRGGVLALGGGGAALGSFLPITEHLQHLHGRHTKGDVTDELSLDSDIAPVEVGEPLVPDPSKGDSPTPSGDDGDSRFHVTAAETVFGLTRCEIRLWPTWGCLLRPVSSSPTVQPVWIVPSCMRGIMWGRVMLRYHPMSARRYL